MYLIALGVGFGDPTPQEKEKKQCSICGAGFGDPAPHANKFINNKQ